VSLAPGSLLCQQSVVAHEVVRDWLSSGRMVWWCVD